MSVIVAGTVRVPPDSLAGLKPHMHKMLAASRAEDGCMTYSYAEDIAEPGLIRVFEAWRDQAALEAHFRTAHMAEWRAAWPQFAVSERRLRLYEVTDERPL
ncbi:MAG TPA: putative quinol monooxygenase [Phenylobacterium sp.]|jgi:quinol monooxygenase YgiN|nr:putative quinol monooxygenase [Phenylobacterium sp.]